MQGIRRWRWIGTLIGCLYTGWAYKSALDGDKTWMTIQCLTAALYFHGAARAHSQVTRFRQPPRDR